MYNPKAFWNGVFYCTLGFGLGMMATSLIVPRQLWLPFTVALLFWAFCVFSLYCILMRRPRK